jgi:hypothetical protein
VDTSAQILFKLDKAFTIAPGQTFEIKGTYADPAGGLPINGQNMITPVATTDYLFNTASDGTGTNITANLQIVSITFGTEGWTAMLKNTYTAPGWVTKFNTRGFGIYNYNPIQHLAQSQASRTKYGTYFDTLDQKYKVDLYTGKIFADGYVEEERDPKTTLKKISIIANRSGFLMQAFLWIDIGYLVQIKIDKISLDGYYFIQGVEEFSIAPGGKVTCTFVIKEALSLLKGLSPIAVDFGGLSSGDALDFGYLPQVSSDDVTKLSISVWLYLRSVNATYQTIVFNLAFGGGGVILLMQGAGGGSNRVVAFQSYKFLGSTGTWLSPTNVFNLNTWAHIVVTYEIVSGAKPTMYINGALQTISESGATSGALRSHAGAPLVIGSSVRESGYHNGIDGIIKDPRIYKNYILSQVEVTALYNGGVMAPTVVTDGLAFQGFAVRTKKLSSYVNQTLTNNLKVRDNVRGAVATVNGAPVGRSL